GIILTFAGALGEFGATLMLAGNIEGKTQTIPTAIYYAVATGKEDQANTLVMVMTVFSFLMIFGLNAWLKKKNYKV
ncbi:molybdate ABC transporter permease subunit, partial [Pseudomonas aeruginosa]|nr:molybdate ABC transporter permease subunit [Pseudomonas aeruginosa]